MWCVWCVVRVCVVCVWWGACVVCVCVCACMCACVCVVHCSGLVKRFAEQHHTMYTQGICLFNTMFHFVHVLTMCLPMEGYLVCTLRVWWWISEYHWHPQDGKILPRELWSWCVCVCVCGIRSYTLANKKLMRCRCCTHASVCTYVRIDVHMYVCTYQHKNM